MWKGRCCFKAFDVQLKQELNTDSDVLLLKEVKQSLKNLSIFSLEDLFLNQFVCLLLCLRVSMDLAF